MVHLVFFLVCLQLVTSVSGIEYDLTVDLRDGQVTPDGDLPPGIAWQVPLTLPGGSTSCRRQGVLKLGFDNSTCKCADIHLQFEDAKGWSFHIRDSLTSPQHGVVDIKENIVEVTSYDKTLRVFKKRKGGKWEQQAAETNFLNGDVKTVVANNRFYADNGMKNMTVRRWDLFPFNQHFEGGGSAYNLYLGMNRAAETTWRTGSGLCWVGVAWRDSKCGNVQWLDGV